MNNGNFWRKALVVAAVLLLASTGAAFAQLQSGNLYGTVSDNQGAALPGATVTLTGIGAPQVQVTNAEGEFRFLGLSPGGYQLKAELEGFSTVDYPNITISVGRNTTIEVTLNPALEEVITVTSESPLLDERKVSTGATITQTELEKIPTARDPWVILQQAPGVLTDRVNVGGNESGQQSNFLGVGSGSRDNVFAVDGVVLTDMNAVGASATYFDFGAFEEVQFTVSSSDVTVATSGVTINQVTKRGTNDWKVNARYLRTDGELQSAPTLANGNKIDSVEEYGADVGGPIRRDKLWIWASYGESDIRNVAQGGQIDRTKLEDLNTKLNFQAAPSNSGVLHYWTNDKLKFGRGASPTRAPETTLDQTTPQDIYKLEDTQLVGSSFSLTLLASRDDGIFTLTPQGGLDADRVRTEDGVLHGTNFDFKQKAIIDQARLEGNAFFATGAVDHELKLGIGYRTQENESGTVWPRGKFQSAGELSGIDGNVESVTFPRNRTVAFETSYDSAWAQDTIAVNRWTASFGLRYDKQEGKNKASSDPGNPLAQGLLPPLNFPGNDAGGFSWESIVPRVSVSYALGEEKKTLLRGTFSQYAEQLGQIPLINRVNPLGYSYAYFYFTDSNGNLVLDPNETGSLEFSYTYNIDPENPTSLVTPNVNDPNLDPALTDEVTFSVDHGLTPNFAFGVALTYRNIRDIPELRAFAVDDATGVTRLVTRDDYEVVEILDGGQPVYDLRSGLSPTGGFFYTNGDREQDYKGVTASFTKRLANRWSARGHFTYADWKWKIGDEFKRFDDPTDVISDDLGFPDGNDRFFEQAGGNKADVFTGSRWSYNLNGLYQIAPDRPWGFNAALSVTGREGYPAPPFASRGSAVGGQSVQLTRRVDSVRNDNIQIVDARLEKEFVHGNLSWTLGIDGFNLTNEDYVLQRRRDAESSRFGQIDERLSPRVVRVGVTLRYR